MSIVVCRVCIVMVVMFLCDVVCVMRRCSWCVICVAARRGRVYVRRVSANSREREHEIGKRENDLKIMENSSDRAREDESRDDATRDGDVHVYDLEPEGDVEASPGEASITTLHENEIISPSWLTSIRTRAE